MVGALVIIVLVGPIVDVLLAGTAAVVLAVLMYIAFVVLVTALEDVRNETRICSCGAPAAETGEQLKMLGT